MQLNYRTEIRQDITYNEHTAVGFLPVEYTQGGVCVQEVEKLESTEMEGMVSRSSEVLMQKMQLHRRKAQDVITRE